MRVAMHQPHYLPWLGLVDKIDRCDLFIVLDDVQFERKGWQHRNYVASKNGPVLLTVPVIQRSRNERIIDKSINNETPWQEKHQRTLASHCYRNSPFWSEFGEGVTDVYNREWERLVDLSTATTDLVLNAFGVTTPMVRSSELGEFPGQKSELLAQLSAKVGATTMLSGEGARGYVDPEVFARYGITVEWQTFRHPEYPQHNRRGQEFLPRMAALDLLLNAGPEGMDLVRAARSTEAA
ncbi:WbqC family protein [Actinorugispora endophytica]|uniref:WbqC family protein n=1 Tax=Actinorugispora endophytica TaxID=1605990 RepID=UPI00105B59E1|nr:WbqC family protein [Actinorugispora endophytica]